jgi:tRNA threonylcarbamoyladenosine biosynthesis protein TsaE
MNSEINQDSKRECFLADADATNVLGRELASCLPDGAVLWLRGELGAGKSTVARAMLRALGVTGAIKSPTYTLLEQYPVVGGDALHLDLYRIADAAELDFLGLADLARQARCWLIEWPERGGKFLPQADLGLLLEVSAGGRRVSLAAQSQKGRVWLADFSKIAASGASVQ